MNVPSDAELVRLASEYIYMLFLQLETRGTIATQLALWKCERLDLERALGSVILLVLK